MYPRGIGPWKLAMLAACLFLWDVMWGTESLAFKEAWTIKVARLAAQHTIVDARSLHGGRVLIDVYTSTLTLSHNLASYPSTDIPLAQATHVRRSYTLLSQIFHKIRHPQRVITFAACEFDCVYVVIYTRRVIAVLDIHIHPNSPMHRVTFVVCDSIVYTSLYAISEPLTCRVHTHTHRARELLSAGVLDPRDKPPAADFKERATIPGVPQLPTGYIFTQWMRCAVSFLSCVTIRPFDSYIRHVYRAPTTRARVHLHVPTTHQWCRLS